MAYNDIVHFGNSVYDFLVTTREILEGGGINDSLVIYQLITLVIEKGVDDHRSWNPAKPDWILRLGSGGVCSEGCNFL